VSRFVVDASVAVKWFLPEPHADAARRLLDGGHTLMAPDLLFPEVANILWKRVRRQEITDEEAAATVQALGALPLQVSASWPLVLLALEIACRTQRTVYDSLYLALAVHEDCAMVTADRKLYDAIQGSPMAPHIGWVEEVS
jgi:predicted nucleic acid-binding protein